MVEHVIIGAPLLIDILDVGRIKEKKKEKKKTRDCKTNSLLHTESKSDRDAIILYLSNEKVIWLPIYFITSNHF